MKAYIEAGAAGVHFEDQLASEKKCGHLGGKVLVPTSQFVRTLVAARLAADVCDVPTVLVARTDALSATLLTSDIDDARPRVHDRRADTRGLLPRQAGHRGADRTLARVRAVRGRALVRDVHAGHGRGATLRRGDPRAASRASYLAYNCSPSFNWRKHLSDAEIERFQDELAELGYRYQFITLAGFHSLNAAMFELAKGYAAEGMPAYVERPGARVRGSRPTATPPPATSARSERDTSTR